MAFFIGSIWLRTTKDNLVDSLHAVDQGTTWSILIFNPLAPGLMVPV